MRSAFVTEVVRSVRHSMGRFLAIVAIVAIGCGFFAGLRMTGVGMRKSADAWYDGTNLYDLELVSTLGLTDATVADVAETPGITAVMPTRSVDVMASMGENQLACKIASFDAEAAGDSTFDGRVVVGSDEADYLNRLILRTGRWPEADDECVVLEERAEHLGDADSVHVLYGASSLDGVLACRDFTVVGTVSSSTYTASTSLAPTTLGSGLLQQVVYVPDGAFDADAPYTECYLRVGDASGEVTATDAYQEEVDAVADTLELRLAEFADARLEEIRSEAQGTLDENRATFERERADALKELDDAKAELDDAEAQLADARRQLEDGHAAYDDGATRLSQSRRQLQEGEAQWESGRAELADGRAQLEAGERELADAEAAFQAELARFEEAEGAYEQGLAQWQAGVDQLLGSVSALTGGATTIDGARSALAETVSQLEGAVAAGVPGAEEQLAQARAAQGQFEAGAAQLEESKGALDGAKEELDAARPQVEAGRAQLDEARRQVEESRRQVDAAQDQLDASRAQLDSGWSELRSGERQLAGSKADLDDGWSEYRSGRADYEDGLATYERERSDALERLADAERELDDAQAKIDDLEGPDIFVLDRTKNYGAASYSNDSERIDAIASVFPFFFFVVAALVALTTMTRMVEDERVLIGTYKALGYSTLKISSKYLAYAAIASAVGALIGIAIMSQLLPWVIAQAYSIAYPVPERPFPLPVEIAPALWAFALGVGCTLAATLASCLSSLRESPAALMQPKAPKVGKRILIERVGPLWRRFSFSWKVTARNIFRYKRRFLMTVIGIAGCTALLVTGFGVRDAIQDIIDIQYGQIVHHDVVVGLAEGATTGEVADVEDYLGREAGAGELVDADTENVVLRDADGAGEDRNVQVICPEDLAQFEGIRTLRVRRTQEPIPFEDDSVILSEKLATNLGVGPGDEVRLYEPDEAGNVTSEGVPVTVTGVTENYLQNFAFMGHAAYEEAFGEAPAFDTIYTTMDDDPALRTEVAEHLQAMPDVDTVLFEDEMIDTYTTMLHSVDLVMIVLIVSAAALAFVVLYNLANINISERVREIASLKVLGFTRNEVNLYVFREILLIVLMGAAVGLVLGVFFEGYVIVTAEVDAAMFGREIHWPSYVYAFALTMAFCGLVLVAMIPKLNAIDMVESLKSVE